MTLGHNGNHVTYKRKNNPKQAKPILTDPYVKPMRYGPLCAAAKKTIIHGRIRVIDDDDDGDRVGPAQPMVRGTAPRPPYRQRRPLGVQHRR